MNPGDFAIVWFWLCVLGGAAVFVTSLCRAAHDLFSELLNGAAKDIR